jgi:hypothetical protein
LKSRWVVPDRLLNAGFEFFFADWPSACTDLVDRWQKQSAADSRDDGLSQKAAS